MVSLPKQMGRPNLRAIISLAGNSCCARSREELVGPSPKGPEIDLEEVAKGASPSEFKGDGPYVQKDSKEEILCIEPPGLRYGIGILYPRGATKELDGADDSPADRDIETTQTMLAATESKTTREPLTREGEKAVKRLIDRAGSGQEMDDGEEFDLSGSNMRRPNSMAVSFLAQPPDGTHMVVRASGGRYEPVEFMAPSGRRRVWWARRAVTLQAQFEAVQLLDQTGQALRPTDVETQGFGPLDIRVEAYSRPTENPDQRLITVCLINRTTEGLVTTDAASSKRHSTSPSKRTARVSASSLIHGPS